MYIRERIKFEKEPVVKYKTKDLHVNTFVNSITFRANHCATARKRNDYDKN